MGARRRGWLRYSLRTLLLFVLLCGSGMGLWFRWEPWALTFTIPAQYPIQFSRDGRRLLGYSRRQVPCETTVFDASNGAQLLSIKWGRRSPSMFGQGFGSKYSTDERWIVSYELDYSNGHRYRLFDSRTGRDVLPPGSEFVYLGVSPDSSRVFLLPVTGKPQLWNPAEQSQPFEIETSERCAAPFSPDGKLLLIGGELWDCERISMLRRLEDAGTISHACFTADGRYICLATQFHENKRTIFIWDAVTLQRFGQAEGNSWAFVGASDAILVDDQGGETCLWSLPSLKLVRRFMGRLPSTGAVSPDKRRLITCCSDERNGSVRIWDIETGALRKEYQGTSVSGGRVTWGHGCIIVSVPLDPDFTCIFWPEMGTTEGTASGTAVLVPGTRNMIFANRNSVRVCEQATGEAVWSLGGHEGDVRQTAISPDGCRVATTSQDNMTRMFHRRRPEYWWGVAWLPEFWLALLFGGGFLWSVWRDRKTLAGTR